MQCHKTDIACNISLRVQHVMAGVIREPLYRSAVRGIHSLEIQWSGLLLLGGDLENPTFTAIGLSIMHPSAVYFFGGVIALLLCLCEPRRLTSTAIGCSAEQDPISTKRQRRGGRRINPSVPDPITAAQRHHQLDGERVSHKSRTHRLRLSRS